ncbi:MAG: cardiolipin synthase [Bdellovibrio sp.]|nr:cardiolipin synthase [Bdellovibrio sp.]
MAKRIFIPTSKKFKIIFVTVLLTIVCGILFLNLRNPQKELKYSIAESEPVDSPHFSRVLGNLMGPTFVSGNKVKGLYNGDEIFPAMLAAIRSAKKTITFESYIYWSGDIGAKFADALSERAKSGVKVHVLIDWVGSQKIDQSFIERMRDAGAEVQRYHALRWYNVSRMNFRTHRKILVVDGKIGFTGGVGIADEWSGNGEDPAHWRDTHYQVEGPVVRHMQASFMDNWLKTRPEVHQTDDYFPELQNAGDSYAQMFKSSSREGGSSVRIMYLLAIAAAKKTIHIESAYFVPDETTIEEIIKARHRGVEVKLIVPGPYTDSLIVRYASREQWGPLLEAGVKIYEYQPALFHCKVFIVDGIFVSIGSTNFDERSFRLNDEANLNVIDRDFAIAELDVFQKDLDRSKLVTHEQWLKRSWEDKIIEKIMIVFRSQF